MGMHKVKGKTQSIQKMLNRLAKNTAYAKIAEKFTKWISDEAENSEYIEQLTQLRDAFTKLANDQVSAVAIVTELNTAGYVPPKKLIKFVLEHGRRVWIKPKFVEQFQAVLSADAMGNLFVEKVTGGKVVVSVGDPDADVDTVKHLIPKMALSTTEQVAVT
jgi:hypothetical protein